MHVMMHVMHLIIIGPGGSAGGPAEHLSQSKSIPVLILTTRNLSFDSMPDFSRILEGVEGI